jgi:GTP-binding protein
VSAHDGTGLDALRARLSAALEEASVREDEVPAGEMLVHRFDPLASGWEVVADGGDLRVRGRRIETAAARTDFENDESRDRFWRLIERLGIDVELRRQGAGPGTTVHIGRAELEWGDE